MIVVSVCLPSDALSQHLLSHLGFSYLGCGVSLHGCSSKVQPLLLTLDEVAPPDLEHGVAPLSPPAPMQPLLLGWEALTYHEIHKNFLKSFKHVKTILSSPANHKQVVDQI